MYPTASGKPVTVLQLKQSETSHRHKHVTFPKHKCNWYFPSRQILSLEYHRLYSHVRAATFLDLWGVLHIYGVFKHSNNRSRKYLYFVQFQYVKCCSLESPSSGCCMSGLQRPQPASCPSISTCECFKEP